MKSMEFPRQKNQDSTAIILNNLFGKAERLKHYQGTPRVQGISSYTQSTGDIKVQLEYRGYQGTARVQGISRYSESTYNIKVHLEYRGYQGTHRVQGISRYTQSIWDIKVHLEYRGYQGTPGVQYVDIKVKPRAKKLSKYKQN